MAGRRREGVGEREKFWREHVDRWERSGQSISGYCQTQEISEGGFHYWKRELKRREGRGAASPRKLAFAELHIASAHEALIEIVVADARRIHVHPGFDEETLARVMVVLERGGTPEAHEC